MTAEIRSFRLPTSAEIEQRVLPMLLRPLPSDAYGLLGGYIQLLYHWNQKMNLTAVRDPELFVELHLAECLRAAQQLPDGIESVLDFGSGAGLPGIPIQIARPELRVTMAECQKKKAAFLREAVRELGLTRAVVHHGRVEDLPSNQRFDVVTLRAVDNMPASLEAALPRIFPQSSEGSGWCLVFTSSAEVAQIDSLPLAMEWLPPERVPFTNRRVLLLGRRNRGLLG